LSDKHQQFELVVMPITEEGYGLALYQSRMGAGNGKSSSPAKVVQIWGEPLRAVIDRVISAIRLSGYRPTELRRTRQDPFQLREEDGVRLGLLFLAVKPLRRLSRIETISEKIGGMEPEELYYWYSKSTAVNGGRRAQRALRILIAEE
jgi:hypothetical protein